MEEDLHVDIKIRTWATVRWIAAACGSGSRFIDVYVHGVNNGPEILVELKYTGSEDENLDGLAVSALEQIRRKDYSRNIRERHVRVGTAFHVNMACVLISK